MTKQEFIAAIAPYCQKYAKQYGFKVASAAIAQACLESAFGTSNKAKYHNYFGLKWRPNRVTVNKGTFTDSGSEQNANGSYTSISTSWYSFENMEKGVEGYFQFINIANYKKVKEATNAYDYLKAIKDAGYATSLNYVDNVYNVVKTYNLTQYDNFTTATTSAPVKTVVNTNDNSPLVDCEVKSPNHSGKRNHVVDTITPHCVVGQLTAERIGALFPAGRQASCNYGIGTEGRICLIVDEINRSWCSSNAANDNRAITIECASDKTTPYAFNDKVYNKLIDLCVDICKRYNKTKLIWIADKNKAIAYNPKKNEMKLTVHRWFAKKACPGDWLMARMDDLAKKVTEALSYSGKPVEVTPTWTEPPKTEVPTTPSQKPAFKPYIVKVTVGALNYRQGPGAGYKVNGTIKDKGIYTIIEEQNG